LIAAVFGEAVEESRVRLALLLLAGLAIESSAKWDRTDHVSPCPQSAGAAIEVGADHPPGRVFEMASGHV
jgi:hypothetical protein